MNKKVIHVLSGGLDSTVLLFWLLANDYDIKGIISFNYGQRHKKELYAAADTIHFLHDYFTTDVPHHIIDISGIGSLLSKSSLTGDIDVPEGHYESENMKLTVVPNRNMTFLSIASMLAINEGANLSIGIHAGDHAIYPDCREDFIRQFIDTVRIGNWNADNFTVIAPFLHMSKGDIVTEGIRVARVLTIDPNNIFRNTWTCYKGAERACGKCGSCTERLEAFAKNKIADPLVYNI